MRKTKFIPRKLILTRLNLAPRTGLALLGIVVCLAGAGFLATKLRLASAATRPSEIICNYGTPNGVVCLNRYRGETGLGTAVVGYFADYDLNERFQFQLLGGMCGGGHVTSTCPFTVGTGLNNHYIKDEIVQIRDYATGYCVGNDYFDNTKTDEEKCNATSGTGGGEGTVFIHNVAGGGGTPGYIESRYWSDRYKRPAWLCSNGYPSDPRPITTNSTADFGGGCQWKYR